MNTIAVMGLFLVAELVGLWLAYRLGHDNGWLSGWEDRRYLSQEGVVDSESRRDI